MEQGSDDNIHFANPLSFPIWALCPSGNGQGFTFGPMGKKAALPPGSAVSIPVGQKLLHGPEVEYIFLGNSSQRAVGPVHILENKTSMAGFIRLPTDARSMEEATCSAYKSIFNVVGERSFCRIWNFVPGINHATPGQLENYKLFCRGRNWAFSDLYGVGKSDQFPAASATGSNDGHLTVVFFATFKPVRNWENPEQIPAYRYPEVYGPRPPSFARASMFLDPDGREWLFISGTAAIKGHQTWYPGDFLPQMDLTFDNLDLILSQAGFRLREEKPGYSRHFKVFLRNRNNLDNLLKGIRPVLGSRDTCLIVEADICRKELEVEIEVTLLPDTRSGS